MILGRDLHYHLGFNIPKVTHWSVLQGESHECEWEIKEWFLIRRHIWRSKQRSCCSSGRFVRTAQQRHSRGDRSSSGRWRGGRKGKLFFVAWCAAALYDHAEEHLGVRNQAGSWPTGEDPTFWCPAQRRAKPVWTGQRRHRLDTVESFYHAEQNVASGLGLRAVRRQSSVWELGLLRRVLTNPVWEIIVTSHEYHEASGRFLPHEEVASWSRLCLIFSGRNTSKLRRTSQTAPSMDRPLFYPPRVTG